MARRRMKSKIQPAEMKIAVKLEPGVNYMDLSQLASIVNRRFYRQGLNWVVSHFTCFKPISTEIGNEAIQIERLPNTWVMSNAWTKGFKAWQEMIKNAAEETDQQSVMGKFLDFKIFADETHYSNGFERNVLPVQSAAGSEATPGQYLPAVIEVPVTRQNPTTSGETAEFSIMAVGPNYGSTGSEEVVSLINGYANSRALPNISDPNVPADNLDANGATPENWLAAIFNDGTSQASGVLEDAASYNEPPYPFEGGIDPDTGLPFADTMYPGGQEQLKDLTIHDAAYFNAGTNANKVTIEGGTFPCGLIKATYQGDDFVSVIINLVPGKHRGYMAESMLEM